MFSGKSTEIIKIIERLKSINKNVLGVVHKIDDRYIKGSVVTHSGKQWSENIIISDKLENIDISGYDTIVVEELQFFENAFTSIIKWVEEFGINVVCAGLDGDFERKPFGDILRLIPYSDKIIKLNALCIKCSDGTLAHFSKRITKNVDKVLVGGLTDYEAVCRKHYLE
jgi:thymidine kinase